MTGFDSVSWAPSDERRNAANYTRFVAALEQTHGRTFQDYRDLHTFSIRQPEKFWPEVLKFCELKLTRPWDNVVSSGEMPGARWFEGATLNFAENLLRHRDEKPALVFRGEERVRRTLSYAELAREAGAFAAALRHAGVKPGERVAAFMPNSPETIIAMLGAASIGAVWSSCSPDFGVTGVLDRFGQIAPAVFIATDGYYFKGRFIDCTEKVAEIRRGLPGAKVTVLIPYDGGAGSSPQGTVLYEDFVAPFRGEQPAFAQLPFNHPLYIMFSSGTTGQPKCIVHGAGGTLLEHQKELIIHTDLKRNDTFLYQTTCGWMMWNWMVSSLAVGCTIVLYDGSPLQREGALLFDILGEEKISVYGTSAKFIDLIKANGLAPCNTHKLNALRTMLSTGSPLAPESFDYVYAKIKSDLCLSSIAGGTDIIGCFTLGNPALPVYRGVTQCLSLGYDVAVFNQDGAPVKNECGELVCRAPAPSMPISFWNDPDGTKYRTAYFERFPGVWCHGDYVMETDKGGLIFLGRSDTVLNPGGVRIGTSEIYRQVEQLPEIAESIVVGQKWQGDERIVLFVKLQPGKELTAELEKRIREVIRMNASPHHVPKKIVAVADIPRTRSNKIAETAVRAMVNGEPEKVKNTEALANPEALEYFRDREERRS